MKLNREVQRKILERLQEEYPRHVLNTQGTTPDFFHHTFRDCAHSEVAANIKYLHEHGLVEWHPWSGQGSQEYARITAKGMDFLADDGGLSAILGVVTIKLHDDTLKSLIEAKIVESDLPQSDKRRWLDQLRSLPAETTKHLAMKLVDLGLANVPVAIAAIGPFLRLHT